MPNLYALHKDIYEKLDSTVEHTPNPELAAEYAMSIGGELAKATLPRSSERVVGKLWASDLGEDCDRKTYYKWHEPDEAEKLMGHTKFKFLYGNILEEAALYLAEEAGHTVTHKQARVEHHPVPSWTVSGRIDAVIDGVVTDVKSTSTYGYNKYEKEGLTTANDAFGYLYQLAFYYYYGVFEQMPSHAAFLWIDKQNGHILPQDVYNEIPSFVDLNNRITDKINVIEAAVEPDRTAKVDPVPEGKSGNMKLCTKCSYCDFKNKCYRDANGGKGLRSYAYTYGPMFLTEVVREPRVPEIR